jgi:cystathionine beta-synthase
MNQAIGGTPLTLSEFLSDQMGCAIYIKKEFCNPGGSAKDRVAMFLIKDGEDRGLIQQDTIIVEASSGNTAIGLAMICKRKGYRCKFFVTTKSAPEKIKILKSLGAMIEVAMGSGGPDDEGSSYFMAQQYCIKNPKTYYCNQYFNPINVEAHYQTTGPEIWGQMRGHISHFLAGVGTSGTITGVGKYLKGKSSNINIIGVEPCGSILQHYHNQHSLEGAIMGKFVIEGIGRHFIPSIFDGRYIDDIIQVEEIQCVDAAYKYRFETGELPGFSSAAVIQALYQLKGKLPSDAGVVLLFCDSGERYASKLYNKQWLKDNQLWTENAAENRNIYSHQFIQKYV